MSTGFFYNFCTAPAFFRVRSGKVHYTGFVVVAYRSLERRCAGSQHSVQNVRCLHSPSIQLFCFLAFLGLTPLKGVIFRILSFCTHNMSSERRLLRDLKELAANPLLHLAAAPLEDNIFEWHGNCTSLLHCC